MQNMDHRNNNLTFDQDDHSQLQLRNFQDPSVQDVNIPKSTDVIQENIQHDQQNSGCLNYLDFTNRMQSQDNLTEIADVIIKSQRKQQNNKQNISQNNITKQQQNGRSHSFNVQNDCSYNLKIKNNIQIGQEQINDETHQNNNIQFSSSQIYNNKQIQKENNSEMQNQDILFKDIQFIDQDNSQVNFWNEQLQENKNNDIKKIIKAKTLAFQQNNDQDSDSSDSYDKNYYYKYKSSYYQQNVKKRKMQSYLFRDQLIQKLQRENELIQQQKYEEEKLKQEQEKEENITNELRAFIQRIKLRNFFTNNANNLESRRFISLNPYHYGLVHEYFPEKQLINNQDIVTSKNPNFLKNLKIFLQKPKLVPIIQKLYKFHPDGKFSNTIDFISVLITIINILLMNFRYFFNFYFFESVEYFYFVGFSIIFQFIEILARLNIGITQEGKVCYDPVRIIQNYQKQYFKYDVMYILLTSFTFKKLYQGTYDLQIIDQNEYYIELVLNLLLCIKFRPMKSTIRTIEHRIIMSGFQNHFLVLIKMLFQIITMSHLIACVWHILQVGEIKILNEDNTWLQFQDYIDKPWIETYMQCFYWATATIMLIGTQGTTTVEALFSTVILFFTVGIFAYILENVAQTFNQINKDSVQYKADLETLNHYMKNKNLEWETQIKVRQQLELCYKSSQEINVNKKALEVISQLPDNLSKNIRYQINDALIRCFTPLCKNFCEKTLKLTYSNQNIMQEISYVTQEKIFTQNDSQEIYMYLVLAGQVNLFYKIDNPENDENNIHLIQTLKEGDLFCIDNFFAGEVPQYSAIATKFSNICRIQRSGFLANLKYNPYEYERFQYIKDQLIQQGYSPYFHRPCIICESKKHYEQDCNMLKYKPNRYRMYLNEKEFKKQYGRSKFKNQKFYIKFLYLNKFFFKKIYFFLKLYTNYKITKYNIFKFQIIIFSLFTLVFYNYSQYIYLHYQLICNIQNFKYKYKWLCYNQYFKLHFYIKFSKISYQLLKLYSLSLLFINKIN